MKVLLAIDGSVYSDAAVAEVARRPWPSQSEVKVITVVEMPLMPAMDPWPVSPAYFEHLVTTLRNAGQSVIDSALKTLKDAGQQSLDVTSEMTQGPPAQASFRGGRKMGRRSHCHGIPWAWYVQSPSVGLGVEYCGSSCEVFGGNREKCANGFNRY